MKANVFGVEFAEETRVPENVSIAMSLESQGNLLIKKRTKVFLKLVHILGKHPNKTYICADRSIFWFILKQLLVINKKYIFLNLPSLRKSMQF